MSIEAMKQVRQIFKDYAEPNSTIDSGNLYWALGVALQVIADAEKQEPVAWRTEGKNGKLFFHVGVQSFQIDYTPENETEIAWMEKQLQDALSKLASSPQRQPLTDEKIAEIASTPCAVVGSYVHTFARAIEGAHNIFGDKNDAR